MAKKKPKKWVQAANLEEGALTAKAKAANMSIPGYCAQANLSSKSKKQCVLARTFKKMAKNK
jgi:hypothetical protein